MAWVSKPSRNNTATQQQSNLKSADWLPVDEFRDIDRRCAGDIDRRCAALSLRNPHRYPLPAYRIVRICRHCEERSDEAIQNCPMVALDCCAEPVIGRAFARPVGSQ